MARSEGKEPFPIMAGDPTLADAPPGGVGSSTAAMMDAGIVAANIRQARETVRHYMTGFGGALRLKARAVLTACRMTGASTLTCLNSGAAWRMGLADAEAAPKERGGNLAGR